MAFDGQKTLVHALLCVRDGYCSRPDCTSEVQAVKKALAKLEAHSATCTVVANHYTSRKRKACEQCSRWAQLQKLRDRFTKLLIKAQPKPTRGCKTVSAPAAGSAHPPLMQRSVTMVMDSFDEEDGEMDLSLLPGLVEGELEGQRKRRDAKHGSSSKNAATAKEEEEEPVQICGLGGCSKPAWHTGMCLVNLQGGRARKKPKMADDDDDDELVCKLSSKPAGGKPASKPASAKPAAAKGKSKGKEEAAAEEVEDAKVQRLIVNGARLAQSPSLKGTLSGKRAANGKGKGKGGVEAAAEAAEAPAGKKRGGRAADGPVTQDDFPPSVGMHIAIDPQRSVSAPLPDAWSAIETALPPEAKRSTVGVVTAMHADGRCDCKLVGCGTVVSGLAASQRQIVCSGCLHANLPHALPMLRCSACDHIVDAGCRYRRAPPPGDSHEDVMLCNGCFGMLSSDGTRESVLEMLDDSAKHLEPSSFAVLTWLPAEVREYDDYVQCTQCDKWYHFVCGRYPAPEQLPRQWRMQSQLFVCPSCVPSAPKTGKEAAAGRRLRALQERRARELPKCQLSDTIEAHLAEELKAVGVTLPHPLVVRVVSRKRLIFPAVKELRARYGSSYAFEFPYVSQAIYAFQRVGEGSNAHDVALFAMYVQEYDADCPAPNTNRVYLSYVDSVRFLQTSPPGKRTTVYHALLSGYLKHAAKCGFEHAHIWVAPPEHGSEYVFHMRPDHASTSPMPKEVLQAWYEKMLERATKAGIVTKVESLQDHVRALTSVRDFPTFDGDFFPDRLGDVIDKGKAAPMPPKPPPKSKGKGAAKLMRSETLAIADEMKEDIKASDYSFLVATLKPSSQPLQPGREKIGAHELVDDRQRYLETCASRHWQHDDASRAAWSTMMLLANLGGQPE